MLRSIILKEDAGVGGILHSDPEDDGCDADVTFPTGAERPGMMSDSEA